MLHQETNKLVDTQIITTTLSKEKRIIYQYRAKRARLDMRNIEKHIEKANKIIQGRSPVKKAKFLKMKAKEKSLNQKRIEKAIALAGIKGYVTNLNAPDEQIISFYHQLWHVEQSFRMSKSDLKARPIFHRKRDSIEAHLTIVFTALAIGKAIEQKAGVSIKRFIKTLRPIRSGTVSIGGKEYQAEPELSTEVQTLLRKLRPGH